MLLFMLKLIRLFPRECKDSLAFNKLLSIRKKSYSYMMIRSIVLLRVFNIKLFLKLLAANPAVSLFLPVYSLPVLVGGKRDVRLWS
jgi:hypothetical protein